MADTLTIACLQTNPVLGDVAANLARQRSMVAEAVEGGAGIVVLPECSTGGYVFESPTRRRRWPRTSPPATARR